MKAKISHLLHSLSFRIMLSYWILGVIPILLISIIGFNYLTVFIQQRSIETIQSEQNRFNELLKSNLDNITSTLDTIQEYMPNDKIDILLSNMSENDSHDKLTIIMNSLLKLDLNIENVILVNKDNTWTHMSRYKKFTNAFYDFRQSGIIDTSTHRTNSAVVSPRHHAQEYFTNGNQYVISIVKNFTNYNGEYAGSIIVDLNTSYLKNILPRTNGAEYFALTDNTGYCIYSDDIWKIDTIINTDEKKTFPLDFSFTNNIPKDNFFFIESGINGIWKSIICIDKSTLSLEVDILYDVFYIAAPLLIILFFLMSIAYSHWLSSPVARILKKLVEIQKGNLNTSLPTEKITEFSRISSGINEMCENLDTYIKKTYTAQLKQKEAELNLLKMQINPHYLYNTLEIINMTAIKHENHEVSSMILSLASQFKDMFSIKTNHTTLSQEIDSVKNYFLFINIRYNNRITLDVKLPDALRDIQIVKFILQPLVENSVKHGFCDPSPDQKMNISINIMRTQENFLIISVFDNGRGIEEKKLKSLVKYINNEQSDITIESVGLKNVCERLRLFYGNDFSVEINSFENLGTNILLKIPLSEELENGNGKNQSSSC